MSYIEIIRETEAEGILAEQYKRYGNPDGTVDNVLKVHSLNPESLEAHCALYIQSCHRPSPVSRAEREMIGVTVSRLNSCTYCQTHHAAGLERLLPADRKGVANQVFSNDLSGLSQREKAMIAYAILLTTDPSSVSQSSIDLMKDVGISDREILDIAQVTAYFAYANRIVLGLGATLELGEGEIGQVPEESRQ
ncbi:MAG: peroxidase-related enzyme [Phycisphaerales bacterium]|nr:peroxidase-related enzyme [Phycisphaerales bacterium]